MQIILNIHDLHFQDFASLMGNETLPPVTFHLLLEKGIIDGNHLVANQLEMLGFRDQWRDVKRMARTIVEQSDPSIDFAQLVEKINKGITDRFMYWDLYHKPSPYRLGSPQGKEQLKSLMKLQLERVHSQRFTSRFMTIFCFSVAKLRSSSCGSRLRCIPATNATTDLHSRKQQDSFVGDEFDFAMERILFLHGPLCGRVSRRI